MKTQFVVCRSMVNKAESTAKVFACNYTGAVMQKALKAPMHKAIVRPTLHIEFFRPKNPQN